MMPLISVAGLGFTAAAAIVVLLGPVVIPVLTRLRLRQTVRSDGPTTHLKKSGTPTMGGLMMIASFTTVSVATSYGLFSWPAVGSEAAIMLWTALIIVLGHGVIGFMDDYIKVALKRPLGLRARHKILAQALLGLLLAFVAVYVLDLGTCLTMPFLGVAVDLGHLYYPFVVFLVMGYANAVNLTDGLDGLAAGSCVASFAALALVGVAVAAPTMAVFAGAVAGACLGFLAHNRHPARVWMGDTGSLALGAALASIAVLTKTELVLVLIGGLYAIEALSVVIQVVSFQTTGRRVFKMAPLHHHYELRGMKEQDVVFFFWIVSLVCGVIGLLGLYGLGR